ncbi:pirin family protein [Arthrobacter sp. 35W]|uniref:pirin family protein n=1 Tax=Arthrobacter sp. 35W TaxID=1132441 RepID=UPI0004041449|nr:pirin family protein [Arthrobacter sp. 35W]
MSNLESAPEELVCGSGPQPPSLEVLEPRMVPLGGPRAMTVRRTLPQRSRSLIGAWCFLDHYGPDPVAGTGGMVVPPHPHTGLQTISWLFTGEVEHRDSAGHHAMVRPGELHLMTAGRGISHSEVSTPGTAVLHGAQLWVALPEGDRFTAPDFESYRPPAVLGGGVQLRVFLGSLGGQHSPVATFTPLLGAEVVLDAGASVAYPVDPGFEFGVLLDSGGVSVNGRDLAAHQLGALPVGATTLQFTAGPQGARLLVLGGTPLGESIVMWWNFVGRSHEEIMAFRADWQRDAGFEPAAEDGTGPGERRFGLPSGQDLAPLPAPVLPTIRLKPRG